MRLDLPLCSNYLTFYRTFEQETEDEAKQRRETTAEEDREAARQRKQRVIAYVAQAEAGQLAARQAAELGVARLAAMGAEARNIWAPPPVPGGGGELLWSAHDGPAPNRYAKEAAAVAECRGVAARDRVLSRMVIALEKEIRSRHWEATALSGPMLRTVNSQAIVLLLVISRAFLTDCWASQGIYADFHELINQSAQDDSWIEGFDQRWLARADSAEKQAKSVAGLEVQVR